MPHGAARPVAMVRTTLGGVVSTEGLFEADDADDAGVDGGAADDHVSEGCGVAVTVSPAEEPDPSLLQEPRPAVSRAASAVAVAVSIFLR